MVKRVSSIEVARAANVSQSTVSRALSGRGFVSLETRTKVLDAARQLGYQTNMLASALSSQRSNIVAIIMGHLMNPFYPYVLERMTLQFHSTGRQTLLFVVDRDQQVDDTLPLVLRYQVDAIVITSATLSSQMSDRCASLGIPVVLFNRYVPGSQASVVCCDNVAGGRLVAETLLDHGHHFPAYIAGDPDSSTNRDRARGFCDVLKERGYDRCLQEQGAYTYESGYAAALKLLQGDDPPDAIFCANDIMGIGAIDAAREVGVAVPEELSIIGFDDIPMASLPAYSLTTIRQPVDAMIETTEKLLTRHLAKRRAKPEVKFLEPSLVVRGSARV